MEHWWSSVDGETKILREKPLPAPLCLPLIRHGLVWDWTRRKQKYSRKTCRIAKLSSTGSTYYVALSYSFFFHRHTLKVPHDICICRRNISCQVL